MSAAGRATAIVFGLAAVAGGVVVAKGLRVMGDEPEWGRVLLATGGVLAVAALAPLFAKVETRLNLLLTGLTGLLVLLPFNAYLAYKEPAYTALLRDVEATRLQQPGADARRPFVYARERTAEGHPTVPALTGRIARRAWRPGQLLPLAGIATATTALCNAEGPYVLFHSDERGFRNARGLPDRADVVLVGDSFTQGECVQEGQDLAAVLRARGHRAVSVGASGSGPLLELAMLTEYGVRLEPRVVVWFFFEENDLQDLREELEVPILVQYWRDRTFTQRLAERQPEIDSYWRSFLEEAARATDAGDAAFYGRSTKLYELVSLSPLRRLVGLDRAAHAPWRRQLGQILAEAKARVEARGGRMGFVFIPGYARYVGPGALDKAEVLAVAEAAGLPTLDFDQTLRATGDPLAYFPFRKFGHFVTAGHALLARSVEERFVTAAP